MHKHEDIKISVVMSVYNSQLYLREAVESILAQSHQNLEYIIIDDGSTDQSLKILQEYAQADPRIRVISRPNKGLTKALNEGIALAQGKYVARMDADDISLPHRLEEQCDYLETHPDVAAVGGAAIYFDDKHQLSHLVRHVTNPADIRLALLKYSAIIHPTVMMRKHVLATEGGYREMFKTAQDYDLWIRLSEKYDLANIDSPVLKYRIHEEQISIEKGDAQCISAYAALISHQCRSHGQPDPLDRMQHINRESLAQAAQIPYRQIDEYVEKEYYTKIEMALQHGRPHIAHELMRHTTNVIRAQKRSSYCKARRYWVRAKVYFNNQHTIMGLYCVLFALIMKPAYINNIISRMIKYNKAETGRN